MGEDKGFEYLKALHKNINQYTKSGAAPAKAVSLGKPPSASPSCMTWWQWFLENPDVKVSIAP